MDTNFSFPRQQAAAARPRPPKPVQPGGSSRESNALRASVLDAALELGLGTNPIVAGWMFDNALPEEDEGEDPIASPGLTYTTSEESSNSALSPSSSAYSSGSSSKFPPYNAGARAPNDKTFEKEPNITIVEPSPMNLNFDQSISGMGVPGGGITFPDMPPPPRSTTPNSIGKKLKKKKKDGYESDGGYMSDAGKKKDKAKKKGVDPDTSGFFETEKEAKKRAKEEKKEQELERKRTKSLMSAAKAAKKAEMKEAGYDTDGAAVKSKSKKSKTSAPPSAFGGDASLGYETDQSATPKKSKTRFFKLSTKSSKADLRPGAPNVPPLPSATPKPTTEFLSLPIAERFATTFGPLTLSGLSEDSESSTPVPALSTSSIVSPSTATPPSSATVAPLPKSSLTFPSVNTRDSQVSTASSSSNGSRSQQPYSPLSASLSPRHGTVESVGTSVGSSSAHHGHGSGSYSTITSSSHQQQQNNIPTDITSSASNETAATFPSNHSAKSGSVESSLGSLRPPALSFPAVRAPSPSRRPPPVPPPTTSPPIAPLKLLKSLRSKASLDNLHLPSMSRARSPSPMPVSPATPGTPDTPFVIVPANSNASSPTLGVPSPMQTIYLQTPSASQSGSPISPNLPRSPARSFTGDSSASSLVPPPATREALLPPPRTVISPPNTAVHPHPRPTNLSINASVAAKASSLSPGPNPNVLAYYDLPPPSPPPAGPLPSVPSQPPPSPLSPPSGSTNNNFLPSPGALRQRVIDRTPRQLPPEFSAVFNGQTNIERGRQSPFPARPVPAAAPTGAAEPGTVLPLRRYRDLYSPTSANTLMPPMAQPEMESVQGMSQVKRARFRSKNSWIEDGYTRGGSSDYGEEEEQYPDDEGEEDCIDLANVLERYEDRNTRQGDAIFPTYAGERSVSVAMDDEQDDDHTTSEEAYVARPRPPRVRDEKRSLEFDDGASRYPDSEYQFDDGRTIGDRTSRWSGSIYSRASIMDEDSSGQTRDRLVRRVEAMLREGGGGSGSKGFVPPPVPRIPDAYASSGSGLNGSGTPGRSWNRF